MILYAGDADAGAAAVVPLSHAAFEGRDIPSLA